MRAKARFLIIAIVIIGTASALAEPAALQPVALSYAKAFSLERGPGYSVARVLKPWNGAASGFAYVFYPRGRPKPDAKVPGAVYVQTPIRSAATFSTTYVAAIEALGGLSSLVGVDSAAYVYSAAVRASIASGKVREVTANWTPNIELLISMAPEAVFAYGMGNEWDVHPKMAEAGLPVVVCAEWMEEDPLGRAEWLKFFGLFYDRYDKAEALFRETEASYLKAKARAAGLSSAKRPTVLVNAPFQGSWTVSGGKSYMAALIADAGGAYLWRDDPGAGGLTLSIEAVYAKALGAEVWLNPGSAADLAAVSGLDSRVAKIKALSSGSVWSNTKRSLPSGANDYFESATFRPQAVLEDLIAVFHPEAGKAETLYYRLLK